MKKIWERLKWQLRIFSRGNQIFEGALCRADEKRTWVDSILENGFIPTVPVKPNSTTSELEATPFAADTTPVGGFQGFATQSMQDLLGADVLGTHNTHDNVQGFPGGFVGFDEFSGWNGFDLNNLR